MSGPPFRAEHTGSLLRPEKLLEARARIEGDQYKQATASLSFEQLRDMEDEAIRDVVRLQESLGLHVVTDGEFRRRSWYQDFVMALAGTRITFVDPLKTISAALPFQDGETTDKLPGHLVEVHDKLGRARGIFTEHFKFLKPLTRQTPKVTLPAPTTLHFLGGRDYISRTAYPDLAEFWNDAVDIWSAEIKDLYALGCRYVQIDDVTYPLTCDPRGQEALRKRGDDPEELIKTYADVLSRVAASAPKDMTVGMHMCRGNNRGKWMGNGGYEFISEVVFRNVDIGTFFMEYDSERAGDFTPLRHVPKGKNVVLGLISTKTAELERKDAIKRRIDEAAKFMPMENLCLSPQCGFASNFMGNPLTLDDEKRKLGLIVELADEVWGAA